MLNKIKEFFCCTVLDRQGLLEKWNAAAVNNPNIIRYQEQDGLPPIKQVDSEIPLFIRKIGEKILEKGEVSWKYECGVIWRCELLSETPQVVFEFIANQSHYLFIDSIVQVISDCKYAQYLVDCVNNRHEKLKELKRIKEEEEKNARLEKRKPLEKAIEQWT